jgi:serine/threonine-protein kinase
MRGRWLVPATVALAALVVGPARAESPSGARSELERGYELRRKGNFVEALPHLLESYRLDPQVKTLINLADSEEHVGKLVDARGHWRAALDQATGPHETDIRQEAQKRLSALDARIPTLKIRLESDAPAGCVVELDGVALPPSQLGVFVPTDPGRRAIVVRAPGHANKTFDVILETAEAREVLVVPGAETAAPPTYPAPASTAVAPPERPEPPPPSTGSPIGYVGIALGGVGLAGIGVGTFFGVTAINKKSQADCPGNVCTGPSGQPATLHDAVAAGNVSTVFFIAGAALVVGGATLWLVAPRAGRATAVAALPTGASHTGGLAVAGTW